MVRIKEGLLSTAVAGPLTAAEHADMHGPVSGAAENPTTASSGASRHAAPSAHTQLLEFACSNFQQLTSETCQALPSDISKASAKHRSGGRNGDGNRGAPTHPQEKYLPLKRF